MSSSPDSRRPQVAPAPGDGPPSTQSTSPDRVSKPSDSSEDASLARVCTEKYTGCIVAHPFLMCGGICILLLALASLWALGIVSGSSTSGSSAGNLLALGEPEVQQYYAVQVAQEESSVNKSAIQPPLSEEFTSMIVFFSAKAGNIWTPEHVLDIWRTEQGLMGLDSSRFAIKGFKDHCRVIPPSTTCSPPFSPLRIFFPSTPYFDITEADIRQLNQSTIDAALAQSTTPEQLPFTDFFFDKQLRSNVQESPAAFTGKVTRTRISFGGPLNETVTGPNGSPVPKFQNIYEDEDEQRLLFRDWVAQYLDFFAKPDPDGIVINFFENNLGNVEVLSLVQGDFILAGAAGVMVVIIVGLQTGSWTLALVGMLNVGLSYPVGLVLYHGLLGIQVNTTLNQLALYVILGIGADDIFVLVDAWRQSELEDEALVGPRGPDGLAKRFNWVWRRASTSMLVTSLTTFVAFIMTAVSPIPAVSSFGVLAALMVFVNYLGIISMYSAFLVIWHKRLSKQCCFVWRMEEADYCPECCCNGACLAPATRRAKSAAHADATLQQLERGSVAPPASIPTSMSSSQAKATEGGAAPQHAQLTAKFSKGSDSAEDLDVSEHRCIERFCYTKWAPWLFTARYAITALGVILLILSIAGATQLSPPEQEESGLPPDSELQHAIDRFDDFPASAQSFIVQVRMMYGVNPDKAIDRSGLDPNDEFNVGKLVLDSPSAFTPHLASVQEYLVETACRATAAATIPQRPGTEFFALFGEEADCWLEDWAMWRRNETGSPSDPLWADMTQAAFKTSVSAWFKTLDGERQEEMKQQAGSIADDGATRIPWIIMTFNSTMPGNPPLSALRQYYEGWSERMDTLNAGAPSGARRGFASTGNFAWFATASVMVESTYTSIGVSFAVAVVFLLIFSGNFIVAGLASVSIVCVVVGLLAFLAVIPDINLGLVESINATILVGLAVDYTVHLAHSYNAAHQNGRFQRSRHALFEIGVSVLGGAVTSLCSAFVLFWATLTFFIRFGQLIFVTLALSLLFSTVWFMATLMIVGPDAHPTADILPLLRRCVGWATGSSKGKAALTDDSTDSRQGTASKQEQRGPQATPADSSASVEMVAVKDARQ